MSVYTFPRAPTNNDDSAHGYSVGDLWWDSYIDAEYRLHDATPSKAVWKSGPVGMSEAHPVVSGFSSIPSANQFVNLLAVSGSPGKDGAPGADGAISQATFDDLKCIVYGLAALLQIDVALLRQVGANQSGLNI